MQWGAVFLKMQLAIPSYISIKIQGRAMRRELGNHYRNSLVSISMVSKGLMM
jgi:hypothetical protein